jgi:hypothetical protein
MAVSASTPLAVHFNKLIADPSLIYALWFVAFRKAPLHFANIQRIYQNALLSEESMITL